MRFCFAPATVVALALVGCSGGDFPETYPVSGTVTYQGKPVEGATVILVPGEPAGRSASGVSDAEGNFSVKTYFDPVDQPDGAVSGTYTVTVSKVEKRELPKGLSPQEEQAAFAKLGPPKSLLPKKYENPNSSGLTVTVTDAAPEPVQLNLE